MTSSTTRRLSALAAAISFSAAVAIPAFAAGPVSVTVNGNAANLNPPPTERAGRVFVPLRGVFEQLGASVVYQSGVINATGRGHNISLKIGSQQATVDGQQQNVDVAPFIIGASTYVPLRFVSQALGATVNYDGSNRVVAINTSGGGNTTAQNPAPQPPPNNNNNGNNSPVTLTNQLPVPNATIQANRTTAQATFDGGTVNPNTIHVLFDNRDVTARAYVSDQGITYTTPVLPAIKHTVRVTGKDSAGAAFDRRWSFTSGGGADTTNSISNVKPSANSTVPNQFTISGHTVPGANVTIQVGVAQQQAANIGQVIGAILGVGGGGNSPGVQTTIQANGSGDFSQPVSVNAPSGSTLGVIITSVDPNYGVAATPVKFNLRVH
ncbi:MAG: copper amine oxidase N-terminal domain-containing protein [Candidatus Eremiobacteraeota bacterium]|nr:copper amine oxidase N-terminal domain-containing protein [Candidatus Eremiobacteraeota bacterium]